MRRLSRTANFVLIVLFMGNFEKEGFENSFEKIVTPSVKHINALLCTLLILCFKRKVLKPFNTTR